MEITNRQYKTLRTRPEFVSLITAGRALNSIAFALQVLRENEKMSSHLEQRQARRAGIVLAGYCYEANLLADELRKKFSGKSYTTGFTTLLGQQFEAERKLLVILRNSVSFHLDSNGAVTQRMLTQVESFSTDDNETVEFYEAPSSALRDFSFAFADLLDYDFMVLKTAELFNLTDQPEADEQLVKSLVDFSNQLIKALDEFLKGVMGELGL